MAMSKHPARGGSLGASVPVSGTGTAAGETQGKPCPVPSRAAHQRPLRRAVLPGERGRVLGVGPGSAILPRAAGLCGLGGVVCGQHPAREGGGHGERPGPPLHCEVRSRDSPLSLR